MSNTAKLKKDISVIEGNYFQSAKRIRSFLFNDNYSELSKYLNNHLISLKSDLDLLAEKSAELKVLESSSTSDNTAIQLSLPF